MKNRFGLEWPDTNKLRSSLLMVILLGMFFYRFVDQGFDLQSISFVVLIGLVANMMVDNQKTANEARNNFENVAKRLKNSAVFLDDKEEIIREYERLLKEVKRDVKALLFSGANSPIELTDITANFLRDTNIVFDTVITLDFDNPPKGIIERIDKKVAVYEKKGSLERTNLQLLRQVPALGIDVMILENTHVFLLLPDPLKRHEAYKALLLENNKDIANVLSSWIERDILPKAEPYNEAKAKVKK